MSLFAKTLLGIIGLGAVAGALIIGIYLRRSTDLEPADNVNQSAVTENSNKNAATNTAIIVGDTTDPSEPDEEEEGSPEDANPETVPVPENDCVAIEIPGKWSLTTDIPGATFTPPYAKGSHTFDFSSDGTANFTEVYNDGETTATAQHKGTWTLDNCSFKYQGTASGSGNDEEVGPFSFTFKITASGEISPSDTAMKGPWLSVESYVSQEGTTQQTVTGEWVAKKL